MISALTSIRTRSLALTRDYPSIRIIATALIFSTSRIYIHSQCLTPLADNSHFGPTIFTQNLAHPFSGREILVVASLQMLIGKREWPAGLVWGIPREARAAGVGFGISNFQVIMYLGPPPPTSKPTWIRYCLTPFPFGQVVIPVICLVWQCRSKPRGHWAVIGSGSGPGPPPPSRHHVTFNLTRAMGRDLLPAWPSLRWTTTSKVLEKIHCL